MKHTNRTLLTSVVALVLCCSMLVGSTFAWFTDEAKTGVNQIQAGTLDIVLLNGDESAEGKPMNFVAADGRETILWEPGCTYKTAEYTLKNNGNLALKYEIAINGIDGDSALLEVIDFTLSTESGVLLPGESVVVQLTGHMAEEAGNEYQGKTLSGIGLTVKAYQHSHEKDSIDEKYDAVVHNEKQLVEALAAGGSVKLGGDIAVADTIEIPAGATVNLNGHTLSAEWIETEGAATVANGTVELPTDSYIYSNITLENVTIDSDNLSVMAYTGGTITLKNVNFKTASTSNPLQNYGGTLNLDNVTVTQEGDANTAWYSSALQVVNEIVRNADNKWDIISQANTTINGGTYNGKKALMISAPGGNVTINGGTFIGSEYAIQDDFAPGNYPSGAHYESVITINGGTFEGALKISAATKLTIYGGTFTVDPSAYVADGYVAVRLADGTYTVINRKAAEIKVFGLTIAPDGENSKIIVSDKEGFLNLTKLFENWTVLFTDGNGTTYTNYANGAGADYYYGGYWTISLEADIDLNNATIDPVTISHPVSTGAPIFKGDGHTIKNAKIVMDATTENEAGLFNGSNYVAFKDLKLDNIHVTGSNVGNSTAGILSGSVNGDQGVQNITITNSSVTGGKYTGGVIGYGYTDVLRCTLTNVTVKGGYKLGGLIGYICASSNTGNVTGNTLTDCTVDGIGGGVYAGGKTEYVIGKVVGNYNCDGICNDNTVTNMTTSATANIGKIEVGKNVTQ